MISVNALIFGLIIVSTIALIYLIYTILLQAEKNPKKKELQISKKDIVTQAKMLFDQKKYKVVEKLAYKYLELKPEHDELRVLLAKSLFATDEVYNCIKECIILIGRSYDVLEMKLLLARAYRKINQYEKAVIELQEVLKEEPDNLIAINELSEIYLETNQKASAITALTRLETLTENNKELVEINQKLSRLNTDLGNYPEAFDNLNKILEIYPEDVETRKQLIELYIKVQNNENAILECAELLKSNEGTSLGLWLLNNLTNLCYLEKDIEKTMEYAEMMLKHPFSDKTKVKTYIAKILIASGKEEEGLKILNELSEKNAENIEVKRLMIETFEKRNNYISAIELYKEILDLVNPLEIKGVHTEMSNCFVKWAKHLFETQEIQECFKIFTLAVKYDSENPEVYYELGLVNSFIKNLNEALLQFKKAISLNESVPKYYVALADCFNSLGNTFEQKNTLLTAQKLDENNIDILYRLAKLYNNQRDRTNEIASLEKIISINPREIDAKYELALILETQGNKEEALKLYQEIESQDSSYKNVKENIQLLLDAIEDESH